MAKKIFIFSNYLSYTLNFRKEFILKLVSKGYKVFVFCKVDIKIDNLFNNKVKLYNIPFFADKINPFFDFLLFLNYLIFVIHFKPDHIFSYTTKCNIYSGFVSSLTKADFIPTVTGLGSALGKKNLLQPILVHMYRISFNASRIVVFQNNDDLEFMKENNIYSSDSIVVSGSGVNLSKFPYKKIKSSNKINFLFVGRIRKDKGIDLFIKSATILKHNYSNLNFTVVGKANRKYEDKLRIAQKNNILSYFRKQESVKKFYEDSSCLINPTFYPEGISNVILEAQSTGRAVICSNITGCKETVSEGFNGYLFEPKSLDDLLKKMNKFIELDQKDKVSMSQNARFFVKNNFNRINVVKEYMKLIN